MSYSYVADDWKVIDAVKASCGGLIIGISVSLLYSLYGNLTGISGFVGKVIKPNSSSSYHWELPYLCGLYAGGYIYIQCTEGSTLTTLALPTWMYIVGGACVGFGSRVGCGCTSGHGISGLARLSPRSFAGVAAFLTFGVVSANVFHNTDLISYEGEIDNEAWYQSSTAGGAVLLAMSLLPMLLDQNLKALHAWLFGAIFAIGLSLSGMTNNAVVIAFLNFNKFWNPALMFVLAFGVGTFAATFWYRKFYNLNPIYAAEYSLPEKTAIDGQLLVGEVIFGIGWGIAGMCPGPVVSILSVPAVGAIFFPSMVAGMKLSEFVNASNKTEVTFDAASEVEPVDNEKAAA
eukprot:GSChrysophyteH1.ASY1.ANO1.677.1 assembled CDS